MESKNSVEIFLSKLPFLVSPLEEGKGEEWLPKACNRKVKKVWAGRATTEY